jgi:hypothetical protein
LVIMIQSYINYYSRQIRMQLVGIDLHRECHNPSSIKKMDKEVDLLSLADAIQCRECHFPKHISTFTRTSYSRHNCQNTLCISIIFYICFSTPHPHTTTSNKPHLPILL